MAKNLLRMLFVESQVDEELAALVEEVADIDMGDEATIKVDKAPLAKIVSALGIEGGTLEADPRGLSMSFDDGDLFRAAHAILNEPDSMHKLASAGWVYSLQGDVAQANEPADFRIRFLEIDEIEPEDMKASADAGIETRNNKIKDILKKGREFATTKPEHNDDNPVEFDDKSSDDRNKGVGKEKDGAQPEGKPKGSTKESHGDHVSACAHCGSTQKYFRGGVWRCSDCTKPLAQGPLENPSRTESLAEGGHKSGCTCGFCKNKGSFGKKDKKKEGVGADEGDTVDFNQGGLKTKIPFYKADMPLDKDEKDESLMTPEDVVNAMLEGNPGTQPGILGTKSFSSTKVPDAHKDRPFTPAPGMVQPDNEIVNKQAKRKVNSGK